MCRAVPTIQDVCSLSFPHNPHTPSHTHTQGSAVVIQPPSQPPPSQQTRLLQQQLAEYEADCVYATKSATVAQRRGRNTNKDNNNNDMKDNNTKIQNNNTKKDNNNNNDNEHENDNNNNNDDDESITKSKRNKNNKNNKSNNKSNKSNKKNKKNNKGDSDNQVDARMHTLSLPLPPCLATLSTQFTRLTTLHGFLTKQRVQVTWKQVCAALGGDVQHDGVDNVQHDGVHVADVLGNGQVQQHGGQHDGQHDNGAVQGEQQGHGGALQWRDVCVMALLAPEVVVLHQHGRYVCVYDVSSVSICMNYMLPHTRMTYMVLHTGCLMMILCCA